MANRDLTALLEDLRSRLDEASATFWSDADLTSWLNQGQADVARRAECLQNIQTYTNIVASTQQYVAPADAVRIHRIDYRRSANDVWPLQFRTPMSMDQLWTGNFAQPSTRPLYYTLWGVVPGAQIMLFPTPAESTAGGFPNMTVWYYRLPVAMVAGSDTCDLPLGWDDLPVLFAEFTALRKDKDPGWKDAKAMYDEKLAELIRLTQWLSDQSGSLIGEPVVTGYPAWLVQDESWT